MPAGFRFYELGQPLSADELPKLVSALAGNERIQLVSTHADDDERPLGVNPALGWLTARYRPGPFWDTELEQACRASPFEDGSARCIPMENVGLAGYADADCQEPLAADNIGPGLLVLSSLCGGAISGLYSTAQLRNRELIYTLSEDICYPQPTPVLTSALRVACASKTRESPSKSC